jgi:hypothetical protein
MSEPVRGLFSFLDDIAKMQEEGLTSEEAWAKWREVTKLSLHPMSSMSISGPSDVLDR